MNLITFIKQFGTDEACRAHMESVRWPNGPICPKCGSVNQAAPVGRRPGVFRCKACSNQFTVTVGTAMEGTHLGLNIWYLAMYLMMSTAKPISAMSLSRQMQIQYRTCWHLLHRLRAMLSSGETMPLSGIIEADETYVGGKPRNRQKHRPPLTTRGRGTDKPMVFAAVERGGEARTAARTVRVTMPVTQARKGKVLGAGVKACARFGGQTRYLWNLFTAMNNARMKAEGKFVFYAELSAMLPKLLKEDDKLRGLPHRAAQMTAQNFDRTLKNYIRNKVEFQRIDAKRKARSAARVASGLPPLKPKKSGIPQFKRRDDHADAFSFVGRECRIEPRRVRLPKIGWVRVRGLEVPRGAALKQVALTQEPDGWHVSIQFDANPKEYKTPTRPTIGIDHGLTALAAWSDAEKIAPPRYARKAEKRVRRLNRERDRRRKGGVNRRRTVMRLAKTHRRVRDLRQNFLHRLTCRMVDTFEGFAVEDLNLKGLMKTRLAKSFADASLGELLRMLRYKSEWACREWRVIGRFQRSTGVCPEEGCGWIGPRLRPGIATWTCGGCGVIHDRDHAASRVILRDATVVRAAGVAPARREPARAFGRKRGALPRADGIEAGALVSHDGPPSNVVDAPL